ncbi:UPF0182 family protein [Candidatus Poribacteria bacterium]
MSGTMKRLIIVVAALVAIFLGLRIWARIYPEWLWFSSTSINFSSVFWTVLKTKLAMGIGFGLIFLVLTLGNVFLVWKFVLSKVADDNSIPIGGGEIPIGGKLLAGAIVFLCVFFSIMAGLYSVSQWEPYLRYANSGGLTFSQEDPIFGKDISYYVFKMPFLRFVRGWFFATFLFLTIGIGALYSLFGGASAENRKVRLSTPLRTHLIVLGIITLALLAWGRVFAMYELLAPDSGVRHGFVYGVGHTDQAVRIPVQKILIGIAILSAFLFFISIFTRRATWLGIGGVALLVVVWVIGGLMVPGVVQRFRVKPQEQNVETKYIENSIKYTRAAYNLDGIEERRYKGTGELTLEDITQNKAVMGNIRLWDWRPLRKMFKQRETRRLQYDFVDVDIDRYMLDGQIRQVMLSARELIFSKIPNQAWVNRAFEFTHGYGLTMIPVNEIEKGGYPRMYIKDIPPKILAPWDQEIQRPEIYYGEGEKTTFRSELGRLPYVIVDPEASVAEEFDYPIGEQDAQYATYSGTGGVPIKGYWRKLAYAIRFSRDWTNILFSNKITDSSRILFHRAISDRVRTIAPFLKYDKDPYLVVSEGKLYWIQDAYTTTHMYPYSKPTEEEITEVTESLGRAPSYRTRRRRIWGNYIRNSVKVVIDAYNGTVTYYLMTGEKGQEDPIADCYKNIFPDLFTDFSEMPPDLKKHIRYPLTMFMIQANKYREYHMKEPKLFFGQSDLWQIATEKYGNSDQPVEPYYVILQLPGSDKEEFMLMLPFTPAQGKKNMVAWLAAKCDPGENGDLGEYGNLMVYNFPSGEELVDGTSQVESYIDQNVDMSRELTLWGQGGSTVIRGNMLAIPIKESMLYVEPIYLEADGEGAIPQLMKVVVSQNRRLEWGVDLDSALAALYGSQPPTESAEDQPPPDGTEATFVLPEELSRRALDQLIRAEQHSRNGDWAKYGAELEKLKQTLQALQEARSQ